MKKIKWYEDKDIVIYFKREPEIGSEADIAWKMIDFALQGIRTFANHLEIPNKFIDDFSGELNLKIRDLKKSLESIN